MSKPVCIYPLSSALKNLIRLAGIAILLSMPASVCAQEYKTTFSQTFGLKRASELSEGDGLMRSALEAMPYSLSHIEAVRKRDSGAQLRFGAKLLITGFPETSAPTEFDGGIIADYRQPFGQGNAWMYRLTGVLDIQREEGDRAFNRIRLGARLRYRHDKMHTTIGHLRLGYRDQNEATFEGYDQSETMVELRHTWRPRGDKRSLSGTLFAETRRAQQNRFSYDEIGLRLAARMPVNDKTELAARLNIHRRTYGADMFGAVRKDHRVKATIGVSHSFSDRLRSEAYVGWDSNASSFSDRAFSGAIAGVNVRITWD